MSISLALIENLTQVWLTFYPVILNITYHLKVYVSVHERLFAD